MNTKRPLDLFAKQVPNRPAAHGPGAMLLLCAMIFCVAGLRCWAAIDPDLSAASPRREAGVYMGLACRLLAGVYLFALVLFTPLWHRLSDRRGHACSLDRLRCASIRQRGTALAPNLGLVYPARLPAGAGATAIVPTAQTYTSNLSQTIDRSRRVVLLGSACFVGLLDGKALGTWLAGQVMGVAVGQMKGMFN